MLRQEKKVIVMDGGFGSELERRGLGLGVPADLNVTHAEEIKDIHRSYAAADIITANSFGINRIKYDGAYDVKTVALAAIENARAAGKPVFFDVGPTGAMMQPSGTLSFDEAYGAYAEIAELTGGLVDGYIAETISDLYELKACVLALKEHTDKPVFATMTFDASGRTLTGSTPRIAAMTLEGLGVDALGVNCSLGPRELEGVVRELLTYSGVPVIVQPNRGLPVLRRGRTCYDLDVESFVGGMRRFVDMGAGIIGGCCGTTPEFTNRLAAEFGGRETAPREVVRETAVCSGSRLVVIDGVKICGERLNPTGKKKLKEALAAGDYDYLAREAVRQAEAGADLLDLNVGVPMTDEAASMKNAVLKVQEYVDLPLQIDSSSAEAIERGVRCCNGVPLINSVNGEDEVMDRVFPIAKKYGAVVLGLTMDGGGVPKTAEERRRIAERIIARAEAYGIPRHRVMIDTLVLTASAEQALVKETVEALRQVRALGVKTALGVSNVSFGLPARGLLNKTFLTMAMTCGLNMPIMNPLDGEMVAAVDAYNVLAGLDEGSAKYIEKYRDAVGTVTYAAPARPAAAEGGDGTLYGCVRRGLKNDARALTLKELDTREPLDVVENVLVRALTDVGADYESGKLFLPQLISSAEAAKEAFAALSERLPKGGSDKGTVVLATVRGDVHDIGKNIVKVVAESYGYRVIDLGKDTPEETVVEAVKKFAPMAVGLSALMTTTVPSMERTVKALRAAGCTTPVFVGGAVLTADIAKEIGADYYTSDALGFVKALDELRLKS